MLSMLRLVTGVVVVYNVTAIVAVDYVSNDDFC